MRRVGPISSPAVFAATSAFAGAVGALVALWLAPQVAPPSKLLDGAASGPIPDVCVLPAGMTSLADAAARSAPSVVSIFASRTQREIHGAPGSRPFGSAPSTGHRPSAGGEPLVSRPDPRPARETGLGSGVILSADGVIVTNRHVVKGAERIDAVLADGRRLPVRVVGLDPDTDLAVLKAEAAGLPAVPVGDPKALRVGDLTLAIGNPYGVGQTVTQGIVSALAREELGLTAIESWIQTDAAINPGSSGGALVNVRGELVGINTAIYSANGASGGIGFAVPSDLALKVARAILAEGRVQRGWIGVSGRTVTPDLAASFGLRAQRGVLVSFTREASPAETAGLRPGDVVTRVGERPVATVQELLDAVAGAGPNQRVTLEVWRGSERLELGALTDRRPATD